MRWPTKDTPALDALEELLKRDEGGGRVSAADFAAATSAAATEAAARAWELRETDPQNAEVFSGIAEKWAKASQEWASVAARAKEPKP